MAATYRVLGQAAPAADATVDVFTATAPTIISTLTLCNRGATTVLYRLAIRPAGVALANEHYLVYDGVVDPADTVFLTAGLTLAPTDVVTVRAAGSGNLSLSLFGTEDV